MHLNKVGNIAYWEWYRLRERPLDIFLDAFSVMPNHIHAILVLRRGRRDDLSRTTVDYAEFHKGPSPGSLGSIIGQYKSRVTKHVWRVIQRRGEPIWQRNYYEHIIRNPDDLNRIRQYIELNSIHWETDKENINNTNQPTRPEAD